METWTNVLDWGYEVSDLGRVRSARGRILCTHSLPCADYLYVILYIPGVGRRNYSVARITLLGFRGSGVGKRIKFKNGNFGDVRLENLEWAEPEGKYCFVYHDDIYRPTKLTKDKVKEIRRRWDVNRRLTITDLAKDFSVDTATVARIVYNKSWKEEEE